MKLENCFRDCCLKNKLKLQSHLHPGRAPVDVWGDPETTGNNRSSSVTLRATSEMIRKHPAFNPGWNKIFNITGMIREV
jgi:hypothetical protein